MSVNGRRVPILAARAASRRPSRPVVGPVRARVAYPLEVPATIRGIYGRAWRCDLDAVRRALPPGTPPDATVAHWIVEAPWSHEVVHSYSIMLVHLRHMPGKQPVTHYLEGATHEMSLHAINPQYQRALLLREAPGPTAWLWPIVFMSQIAEPTDEAAQARVIRAAELVCEGRVSPYPDHVGQWIELFGDCMMRVAEAPPKYGPTEEEAT